MKKAIYIAAAGLALTACQGTKEYDRYVDTLKKQTAVIDTISSPASYAVYLDSLSAMAREFDDKGVKLSPEQAAELSDLSKDIQQALTDAYQRIAQTPVTLPDSIEVPE